jgi:aminotransferase EvaB
VNKLNFLPAQYHKDSYMKTKHNYLSEQFYDYEKIFTKIKKVVKQNDFTLGTEVNVFEKNISKLLDAKYVVAVGSGTDALMLSLKVAGVTPGSEVITTSFTFYATIGAIVILGAKPVYVDIKDDFNIDTSQIEKKITKKTKAILPVHWAGRICDMSEIKRIANKYQIPVIEDACHAITANKNNNFAGKFGDFGCFSLHPLKNLNVWGDGGYIVVKKKKDYRNIQLLRNHGLVNRNKNLIFGYNSRLDTIQAVVANHLLKKLKKITKKRIINAKFLDKELKKNTFIEVTERESKATEVFHLYCVKVKKKKYRNELVNYLKKYRIDAKIHYPTAMHRQPASKKINAHRVKLPKTDDITKRIFSLPVHEYVSRKELKTIVKIINQFFYG